VVADAILGSNANDVRECIETYWPHLALVALMGLMGLPYWAERRFNTLAGAAPPGKLRDRMIGTAMLALFAALHLNDSSCVSARQWTRRLAPCRARREVRNLC
jgi:hypothetical protein